MKMKWNAKKFISNMLCITSAIVLIWMMASFMEVVCKNTEPNPTYSKGNMIVNIFGEANNND